MAMWFADATGFYYHTGSQKRLFKQLRENPKVELGFYNPGDGMGTMQMVRITGKIFIFRIAHGEAQYWNMGVNCKEKDIPPIVF